MNIETLQFFWYCAFIISIFAYAALDGFDIGVGCLHLFAKTDTERRIFLNSIGPMWDGNSLWVIITVGALLAGFPGAFSTLFSTLYIPSMFLIFGYTIRSVAIEFRSKMPSTFWRNSWDVVFAVASYSLALGFGIILANLIHGLPITTDGELSGGIASLFPPYTILLGIFTTLLFMLHGALFLNMKTEGELQLRIRGWLENIHTLFLFVWAITTMLTLIFETSMTDIFRNDYRYFFIVLLALIGIIAIPRLVSKGYEGWAFLSSFLIIASLVLTYAIGTFPAIVKTRPAENSLTIYNSSSSASTLELLIWLGAIGMPLFLFYGYYTYKVFKGKVELDAMSY